MPCQRAVSAQLRRSCPQPHLRYGLTDEAAAEANCHRVGAGTRLKLGQEVADVGLDRLLREVEPLADLPVHEALRDQLQHLDLPHRRLLLEFPERALERDYLAAGGGPPACGDLLKAPRMIRIAGHDLFAFSSVHAEGIGGERYPL